MQTSCRATATTQTGSESGKDQGCSLRSRDLVSWTFSNDPWIGSQERILGLGSHKPL